MRAYKNQFPDQAFYGIGIMHASREINVGTLWRSAYIMGAAFIFTVAEKYQRQSADVVDTPSRIPLYHYRDIEDLKCHLPCGARLIGVEMTASAEMLSAYSHPKRAVYLLGGEATGLPPKALASCHQQIKLPGDFSLNVAVAGSIVMHDRISKLAHVLPAR